MNYTYDYPRTTVVYDHNMFVDEYSFPTQSRQVVRGITFEYGAMKENSVISEKIGYWWGIKVDGRWFWRNSYVKDNDNKPLAQTAVEKIAKENTALFLNELAKEVMT